MKSVMMIRPWLAPILLGIFAGGILRAQDSLPQRDYYIGPVAGYEIEINMGQIPVFRGSADCGTFTTGTSRGIPIGVRYLHPTFISPVWGLSVAASWSASSGGFITSPTDPLIFRDTINGGLHEIPHHYRLTEDSRMIRGDIGVGYRPAERLTFGFGISAGYRLAATVTQTDDITGGSTRFSGGRSQVTMTEGEQLTLSPGTFGLFTNISYMLPLSKRVSVLPELSLRYDLPSLLNEHNWHSLGITMGAGVMFNPASDTAVVPPPAVAQANPPPPPQRSGAVTAAIDLYSVDQANNRLPAATVHIYEVLYRRRSGVLGSVYFDRGSSAIPSRYRMISRDETRRFVADSLAGLDAMRIHYEALNLLGARLRETPSAAITLGGLASKGEPAALGRARAESIRRYLADIWGIDTSRVSTAAEGAPPKRASEKSEDGRAENRRVEVTGSRGVTSPIVMERTRRDFEPPLIAMDPKFTAGAGVKRWNITLTRDADTIGRYSSLDTGDLAPNINWQITSDRAGIMQTSLQAELTVEDSLGNVVTGNAKLPLVIERNIRVVDRNEALDSARERITYTLLPFDYNSAELGGRNQGVIREIAAAVRNGARIRVTGYADRTGSNAGNIDLSRRRAESAARTLELLLNNRGVRDARLATSGEGVSDQFSNDLPEGRALSREVEIVIEQEIPKGIGRAPRG